MSENWKTKREAQEYLILLVLGAAPEKAISILHLEKEVFLLWNFHPMIKELLRFVAHYRGPYSSEITNIIKSPTFITGCWNFEPPKKGDRLTGGCVRITPKGETKYKKHYDSMIQREGLSSLLAGIKIVRTIYDDLRPEDLLLLIYDTYPKYTEKSVVAKEIYEKRDKIVDRLLSHGIISDKKAQTLKTGDWHK